MADSNSITPRPAAASGPLKSFLPADSLRSLIISNNLLLMVMSRFGISLGFGDKRVDEVCREDGVDCHTFLAVCNFISGRPYEYFRISLPSLMGYLRRAHSYFLDFQLLRSAANSSSP